MLDKQNKQTFELDDAGVMHVKTTTIITDDGEEVSKKIHRTVLSPEQGDYDAKVADLKAKLDIQLIDQVNKKQFELDAEKSKCAAHMAKIAELQDENQALLAQVANLEAQLAEAQAGA